VLEKGVAIGAVGKREIECFRVIERLLHSTADGVVVVLGLNNREGKVRFVGEDVIRFLRLPALDGFTADDDAPFREVDFLAHLRHHVPLLAVRTHERGRDELRANVRFRERFFVHADERK
jgi:hypothetical protein